MSLVTTEHVLVAPTSLFHEVGEFQGYCREVDRYLDVLLDPLHVSFRPRSDMENDSSFKQLIPYVIFRHGGGTDGESVFAYTRGKGQGESRLHHKRSVGVGGHISSDDAALDGENPYDEGLRRELEEEVIVETDFRTRCVGLINDDETEVGRVHLGVVHLCDVESPRVRPRESEIIQAGFQPVGELLADLDSFESWSQICLEALF